MSSPKFCSPLDSPPIETYQHGTPRGYLHARGVCLMRQYAGRATAAGQNTGGATEAPPPLSGRRAPVVCLVNSASFSDNDELFHVCGAMVQRLARGPFKAKIRVRFPLALPSFSTPSNQIQPDSR